MSQVLESYEVKEWIDHFDRRTGGEYQSNSFKYGRLGLNILDTIQRDQESLDKYYKNLDRDTEIFAFNLADQRRNTGFVPDDVRKLFMDFQKGLLIKFAIAVGMILILSLGVFFFASDIIPVKALLLVSGLGLVTYGTVTVFNRQRSKKFIEEDFVKALPDERLVFEEEKEEFRQKTIEADSDFISYAEQSRLGANQVKERLPLNKLSTPYMISQENLEKIMQKHNVVTSYELGEDIETDDLPEFTVHLRTISSNDFRELRKIKMSRKLHSQLSEMQLFIESINDAIKREEEKDQVA